MFEEPRNSSKKNSTSNEVFVLSGSGQLHGYSIEGRPLDASGNIIMGEKQNLMRQEESTNLAHNLTTNGMLESYDEDNFQRINN